MGPVESGWKAEAEEKGEVVSLGGLVKVRSGLWCERVRA